MVSPDLEAMLCSHQVLSPVAQGVHDGQEFFIMNLIVALSLRQGPGPVGHRVPLAVDELAQYGPIGVVRGVALHPEGSIIDGNPEDQVLHQGLLELLKGRLLCCSLSHAQETEPVSLVRG